MSIPATTTRITGQVPTGKTLWVDATNGNNTTAVSGRFDKPYLTPVAARTAAGNGDGIVVRAGDYAVTGSLAKNGVNWHFETGATVTSTDPNIHIFDDGNTAMSFKVTGKGRFVINEASDEGAYAILLLHTSSSVQFDCDEIYGNALTLVLSNGTLSLTARSVTGTGATGGAINLGNLGTGTNHIDVHTVTSSNSGVFSIAGGTNFITVNSIVAPGAGTEGFSVAGGTTSVWVKSVDAGLGEAISQQSGTLRVYNARLTTASTTGTVRFGLGATAATMELVNCYIEGTHATMSPIHYQGSPTNKTLILRDCEINAVNATTTIVSDNAQTVQSYGSVANKAAHGNITIAGNLSIGGAIPALWLGTSGTTAAAGNDARIPASAATTVGQNLYTLPNPSAVRYLRINANNTISALNLADMQTALDVVSNSWFAGFADDPLNSGDFSPLNWRTGLGGTTIGQSLFTLTNAGAVRYLRLNADSTVSVLNLADMQTALDIVSNSWFTGFADDPLNSGDFAPLNWRTGLGGTTVGQNLFTLANPGAVTFLRLNADNGVTARSASDFRGDLGLIIGTHIQAHDAGLLSIAGLTTAANKSIYTTASDTYATYDLTAAGRALLDDADAAAQRTTLGGTTVGQNLFTLANPGAVRYLRLNADNTISALDLSGIQTALDIVSNSWFTGFADDPTASGDFSPSNWRTALGGTTVGRNLFTLANPSAVRYLRLNADNSVSARTASEQVSDLGAATAASGTRANAAVPDFLSTFGHNPAYAAHIGTGNNVALGTANNAQLVPVIPQKNITLNVLTWFTGTTSSGNYDIGIYDEAGTRLWSKGSTAWPAITQANNETVSPGVALVGGTKYLVAFAADNTTGLARGISGAITTFGTMLDGSSWVRTVPSSFPLPASITPGSTASTRIPLVVLREA